MLYPSLLISINELLISIISFNDINKYGLNVKTAAHIYWDRECNCWLFFISTKFNGLIFNTEYAT